MRIRPSVTAFSSAVRQVVWHDGRKEPGAEKTALGLTAEVKPATDFTSKANAAVYDALDFDDKQEYEFATRGLIDAPETLELKDEDGTILWSQEAYAFLDDYEKAPDSVNPSLWENTKNNHVYGLFEVTDGIYRVRGYDIANLTVVKGDTGWIVFDTLMSVECSQAAMQLIENNLGKFPVKALSAPMLFDYMTIVMDKQALADRDFTMNVILPDVGEQHMLRVKNGVLLVYADTLSDDADVSITCPKDALFAILTNNQETVAKGVKVEGSAELLTLMMENMNQIPITGTNPFNIIEP